MYMRMYVNIQIVLYIYVYIYIYICICIVWIRSMAAGLTRKIDRSFHAGLGFPPSPSFHNEQSWRFVRRASLDRSVLAKTRSPDVPRAASIHISKQTKNESRTHR